MMTRLVTYAAYYSEEEAKNLTELLEDAGIHYQIEHDRDVLDKIYIGDNPDPMIAVKISPDRFEEVNKVLRLHAKERFNNIHPDYYLFNFTDDELISVVQNKDEWNAFDQGLAEKILSERNVEFDKTAPTEAPSTRYEPSKVSGLILVLEYIIAIIVPYAGILIGLATIAAFRTLHNGTRVRIYDEGTHMHGKIMIGIGIVRTLSYLFLFL